VIPLTGKVWKMADLWAVGIMAYVMVTKVLPFFSHSDTQTFIKILRDELTLPTSPVTSEDHQLLNDRDENSLRSESSTTHRDPVRVSDRDDDQAQTGYSEDFLDFAMRLMQKNPYDRMSIEEALQHPWIRPTSPMDTQLNETVLPFLTQFGYQSKLKQLVTFQIAEYGSPTNGNRDDRTIRMHFDRLDIHNNGRLNDKAFEELLLSLGYDEKSAYLKAMKILQHADLDHDGFVDFREFTRLWHRKLLFDPVYISKLFNACDCRREHDGYIGAEEIQLSFGGELHAIRRMMTAWDDDHDGRLSLSDWTRIMQEYPPRLLVYGYLRRELASQQLRVTLPEHRRKSSEWWLWMRICILILLCNHT